MIIYSLFSLYGTGGCEPAPTAKCSRKYLHKLYLTEYICVNITASLTVISLLCLMLQYEDLKYFDRFPAEYNEGVFLHSFIHLFIHTYSFISYTQVTNATQLLVVSPSPTDQQ